MIKGHRTANAEYSRRQTDTGREIGPPPKVVNPDRRARCRYSFREFCLTYFPDTFVLRFSDDHLKAIAKIEDAALRGALFAFAMPRGSGKSTLAETAVLWSALYEHKQYVVLIGADAGHANRGLENIKAELAHNDLLHEDFPEVTHAIRSLAGIVQRAKSQLQEGEPTGLVWTTGEIMLPNGAIVQATGITGSIRGRKVGTRRPDLVIADDCQTDESAESLTQSEDRERILAGAVLGLAGPGKKISGFMPCTVIRTGDMADRMLDVSLHPEWNGTKTKLLYSFPTNLELWQQYRELRTDFNPDLPDDQKRAEQAATEFYAANRAEMDAGAVVAWEERRNPDELSALQHCMNLFFRDGFAFFAEYQNEPKLDASTEQALKPEELAEKINRIGRGRLPAEATHLTAFIDVQGTALFWVVAAWEDDFTGYVVDYGTYPDQRRPYFRLNEITNTLAKVTAAPALEGQLRAGLDALTAQLLGKTWLRDDGTGSSIERCLIDANWGQSTDVVYKYCRESKYRAIVSPSHGKFVGATSNPLTARQMKPGERYGLDWIMPIANRGRVVQHVLYDTNAWKSFVASRFRTPAGSAGCLSVFGDDVRVHRMFFDHVCSEYPVRAESTIRVVDEWKLKPNQDNHWFDCLVGCHVAASMQRVTLGVHNKSRGVGAKPREKVSFSELQKRARERRERGAV